MRLFVLLLLSGCAVETLPPPAVETARKPVAAATTATVRVVGSLGGGFVTMSACDGNVCIHGGLQ